ncbi:hypothetical protein C7C46_05740 [Streptomyces tateyamensis]|uniref:Plasmid mobilization relaxosome protein MobC n=1 Tax=Streptomyces tateyamensis TaxID=565073 RepID=A0A2V4NP13_9ACTN|nr:hypothetical protein C7C46_05740 [Streptomyces tateyamensis]
MPSAGARSATPDLHREGAAKEEKPSSSAPARAADSLPLAVVVPARAAHRVALRADRADAHRAPKRRRRDDENPKHTKLSFRVSPEVKAEIERRAAAEHLAVAHYLSLKVLSADGGCGVGDRDARLDEAIDELRALRRQYAGAANNLNQLGRDHNSGIDLEPSAVRDAAIAVHRAFDKGRQVIAEIDSAATRLAKAKRR